MERVSNHVDELPRWDAWCWRIWWALYASAIGGFIWWYVKSDALAALLGLVATVGLGLVAFMFWSQWYPERKRRSALARHCRSSGFAYSIKKWSLEPADLDTLPLFQKGAVAWPVRHLIQGQVKDLHFQILDFAYISSTFHTPRGSIEAGRRQTVFLCQTPMDWPQFVLQPRSSVLKAVSSLGRRDP